MSLFITSEEEQDHQHSEFNKTNNQQMTEFSPQYMYYLYISD